MVHHTNRRSKLLSLFSTVTLLGICSAFYIHKEIPKRPFVDADLEQPRRAVVLRSCSSEDETTTATGPRSEEARTRQRRQQPPPPPQGRSISGRQRNVQSSQGRPARSRTTTSQLATPPFDGKILSSEQTPNEQAPPFDLFAHLENKSIRCMSDFDNGQTLIQGNVIEKQPAFEFLSLDDLTFSNPSAGQQYQLPGFSKLFNSNATFRWQLRHAMRHDIYDTTPQYQNLSLKAKEMLLLPDSSLQGSWRRSSTIPKGEIRMKRLTQVLQESFSCDEFGSACPTGDDLMQAIGNLCGPEPSTHFIDIVGVLDRRIPHSWHQDTGRSGGTLAASNNNNNNSNAPATRTVLWGFPPDSDFASCGVFSHVVSLQHESQAPPSHPKMQPLLFDGKIDNDYIVRPSYGPGRELLMYRDNDVLHSSPDVAYRTSVMRFM
jgi:hypothetical protein